jgi:hypothetical protein
MRTKRRPPAFKPPPLTVRLILQWADDFYRKWRRWPKRTSGFIAGTGETWSAVDGALFHGHRGLPRGGSLIKLLAEHRGYRHRNYLPRLTAAKVLRWADLHKKRTGSYPTRSSGPVLDAPGESWNAVCLALRRGSRGLKGRTSLAELLARRRGRRHPQVLPDLTVEQVLGWALAYRTLFSVWPTSHAGPIGNTGETWNGIDKALARGTRGLPGGSSLARLLKEYDRAEGNRTPFRRHRPVLAKT